MGARAHKRSAFRALRHLRRIGVRPADHHRHLRPGRRHPGAADEGRQRRLWNAVRLVAEPGGAAALAALVGGAWVPPAGAKVAVVVCGSNTDPAKVA